MELLPTLTPEALDRLPTAEAVGEVFRAQAAAVAVLTGAAAAGLRRADGAAANGSSSDGGSAVCNFQQGVELV